MNNNQKATKRALLTSVMALVMCVVMLVGTTFAWFTDTASTGVNKITSGNLHVEIQNKEGTEIDTLKWVDKDGNDIANQDDILWEPGCTYLLTPFKIANTGNLALKYKIVITGLDGDSPLLDVIKFTYKTASGEEFDMSAEGHLTAAGTPGASTGMITVSAHMDEAAGNDYMGKTLTGIKFTVLATQDTVENDSFGNQYDAKAQYPATVSEIKAKYGVDGLKMPEGVVITTESDSEGTNGSLTTVTLKDYEAFVYFTQVFDHAKAYEARKALLTNDPSKLYPNEHPNNIWYTGYIYKLTVKMDCDIDLENASVNPFLFADIGNSAFTFDGNGHTIKNANLASSTGNVAFFGKGVSVKNVTLDNIHVTATGNPEGQSAGIVSSNANADIDNVTVKNSSVIGGKWTGAIVGYNYGSITNCTVENCTVSGQYKVGGIVGYICGSNDPVSVTGNKLTNVTVKAENVLVGKTAIIGKIVSNWNAPAGTCKDNTFSGTVPDGTNDIGKIESGCIVTQ